MLLRPTVLIPAVAYAIIFCFASPGVSVIIPTAYGKKFGLNPQQVGLQFLSVLIGAIIGEQIGGYLSDKMMRQHGVDEKRRAPEFRMWLSYLGFATTIGECLVQRHCPLFVFAC